MNPLTIQAWLRQPLENHTVEDQFAELKNAYAIKAKRHSRFPNLVLFKYDQIASPFSEQIVRECRGIILDESDDWRVISRAFDKFFNHGEGHAAAIDWSTARVQEKVDGSLCVLYPYAGEWHVATSGTPDASGEVHGRLMTFAELFWDTFKRQGLTAPDPRCRWCFSFELTSPLNRIVVPHADAKLTLLAARELTEQKEAPPDFAMIAFPLSADVRVVRSFPLGSFEDIAASFAHISPLSQEGYVVVDAAFNRVKVKHPGYVALHHAKDGMGTKAFVEIARSGETSEVLTAFPEFKPMMEDAVARVGALVEKVTADYERLKDIEVQRDFAKEAVTTTCSSCLFALRAKKTGSVREYFKGMRLDALMSMLGYSSGAAASGKPTTWWVDA